MSKFVTLHGFGGANSGVELNFEIVGGVIKPENPTENMIWVNTDVEITNYIFSATEPTEPIEGMIWIVVSSTSKFAFNVLKENQIRICPILSKQYISGAWVTKVTSMYCNGAWGNFTIDYIKNGVIQKDVMSWVAQAMSESAAGASLSPSVSTSGEFLKVSVSYDSSRWGTGIYRTSEKVNLTGIDSIVFDGYRTAGASAGVHFDVWSKIGPYSYDNRVMYAGVNNSSSGPEQTYNVSTLDGEYYIGFTLVANQESGTTLYIRNLRQE